MTQSFSTITPGNFELTPCRVTYKGVDLGATLGNVKVKITEKLSDLKSDQLGSTIIDKRASGFDVQIETSLAETQLKANWKVLFPTHKLVTNGPNSSFYFDSDVGASMAGVAGALVLHPLSRADSDLSGDIKIFLATAEGQTEYDFSPSAQQAMKIVWTMYPDFTTQPPRFMIFGDPSIGITAASAGSAVAATGNTGGGSVGSIAVNNTYTKTETITMVCEKPGATGTFYVSGSQSGPLGLAVVGSTFNSNPISFLISDGSPDFASGDSFTIATTASNVS